MVAGSIALVVTRATRCAPSTGWTRCSRARRSSCSTTRARRALLRRLLGDVLPADLRGRDGQPGLGRPAVFDRYIVPLALILVLLSGIGPVIAWRRATRRTCGGISAGRRFPASRRARRPDRARRDPIGEGAAVVRVRGLRVRRRRQELWRGVRARRAAAREAVPSRWSRWSAQPAPLRRLPGTPGMRCSSAWPPRRASRRCSEVRLSPGQSAQVGGYRFTYVKPVAELHAAPNGRLERISFGARCGSSAAASRSRCAPRRTTSRRRTRRSAGVALLRRRVDHRGGARLRPAQRRLGRGRARHRQLSRGSPRATGCSPRPARPHARAADDSSRSR